jgi:uncharacterized protein (DUF1501 family)
VISRRVFLKDGALTLVSLGFAPAFLARTAQATASGRGAKRLIAIFQRGAVDGLSLIVPFGDRGYYAARPTIAIPRPTEPEHGAIDLDGFFGLHPRLGALATLWKSRQLAIVHACGSPDSTRSHFDAQDFMETATPGVKSTGDGWLNRYLHASQASAAAAAARGGGSSAPTPFRAVALTAQLPRMLQGKEPALAMARLEQFTVRGPASGQFERAYGETADAVLNGTGRDAFDAMRMLREANPLQYDPDNGADYPRSPFGQALKQIAQLTKANVGLEVAFADVAGWDTHVNQGAAVGQLATRLDDFSRSIAALVTDLGSRMEDTVVVTMSEFGRAVNENGNRGTDHGHGNAMMVIGGGVRGGVVHGRWPGLAVEQRYDRRDLAITTDFRDVFAEIVVKHLGVVDASSIFPGYDVRPSRFPGLFA